MLVRFAYYHSDFARTHYYFSFLFRNLAVPADKYLLKSKESDLSKDSLILIYKSNILHQQQSTDVLCKRSFAEEASHFSLYDPMSRSFSLFHIDKYNNVIRYCFCSKRINKN